MWLRGESFAKLKDKHYRLMVIGSKSTETTVESRNTETKNVTIKNCWENPSAGN